MNVIKEEHIKEYEKRVSIIQNVIAYAYSDYYYLVHLEPYLEKYKPKTEAEVQILLPARNFMNSIVRTLQEEFILIICSLDDDNDKTNSIKQLHKKLKDSYLVNFDIYSKQMREMPEKDTDYIKFARNKAIAHIQFECKNKKVYMVKVKNRLEILKNCFNSYLFDDMVKYKINDNLLKKIETESQIGVAQFFSGLVNMICNR